MILTFGQTFSILTTLGAIIFYVSRKIYKNYRHKDPQVFAFKYQNVEKKIKPTKSLLPITQKEEKQNLDDGLLEWNVGSNENQEIPNNNNQLDVKEPNNPDQSQKLGTPNSLPYIDQLNPKLQFNAQQSKNSISNNTMNTIRIYNHQDSYTDNNLPIENQFVQSQPIKKNINELLDKLIKNNRQITRCWINPICEFVWMHDPNPIEGKIYCPMCDDYAESTTDNDSFVSLLTKCVYCNLEMEEQFVTSCGCTYHDDCLQKHINQSQGNPSIKCARCTKPIHKGLAKYGNLKEEQKNQLFDNQLAIIKQQNKCQSGYFKCQICGRLYNQDECGCQKIDLL